MPPNSGVSFWDLLQDSISAVKQDNPVCNIVITGDLNSDINTRNWLKLQCLCSAMNLITHVSTPTRIISQTVLDQFISNVDGIKNVNILDPIGNSNHCTISIELSFDVIHKKTFSRLVWNYDGADFDEFREKLSGWSWEECFSSQSIDSIANTWSETFLNIARECIPNKVVKIYPNDKPFYNNRLRQLKKQCTKARKLAMQLTVKIGGIFIENCVTTIIEKFN